MTDEQLASEAKKHFDAAMKYILTLQGRGINTKIRYCDTFENTCKDIHVWTGGDVDHKLIIEKVVQL